MGKWYFQEQLIQQCFLSKIRPWNSGRISGGKCENKIKEFNS